jgi:hypothetical protein
MALSVVANKVDEMATRRDVYLPSGALCKEVGLPMPDCQGLEPGRILACCWQGGQSDL